MSVMVQIRNMPDEIHRTMKARAAEAGMSLSDYLLREIQVIAKRPTIAEMVERLRALPPIVPDIDPADLIREERDRR